MITVEPGKYQTHASVDAATLAADIARRCKQAKFHPSRMEWSACCPCHDDRHPSLSITWNDEGVGLHCHAGCKTADIVHALGLTLADLFVRADHYSNGHGRPVEVYDYVNEAGYVVHQTLRYPNKYFPQRRPDPAQPGKYIDNLRGIDPILYHLPDVLAALKRGQAIYITEGEKDANTVTKLGLTATTNPMGFPGETAKFLAVGPW
jgi:putative DNA primase/helicase